MARTASPLQAPARSTSRSARVDTPRRATHRSVGASLFHSARQVNRVGHGENVSLGRAALAKRANRVGHAQSVSPPPHRSSPLAIHVSAGRAQRPAVRRAELPARVARVEQASDASVNASGSVNRSDLTVLGRGSAGRCLPMGWRPALTVPVTWTDCPRGAVMPEPSDRAENPRARPWAGGELDAIRQSVQSGCLLEERGLPQRSVVC